MLEEGQLTLFSANEKSNAKSNDNNRVLFDIDFSRPMYSAQREELKRHIEKSILAFDQDAKIFFRSDEKRLHWLNMPFFALDVETTGLDPALSRVVELALVPFNMSIDETGFSQLFCIEGSLPKEITTMTGITDAMLLDKPKIQEKTDAILSHLRKAEFIVAYNAKFDRPFLESEMARIGKVLPNIPWLDPFVFICEFDRFKKGKKLVDSAQRWGVFLENAHRAQDDAKAAGELMLRMAEKIDCHTLEEVIEKQKIYEWRQAHSMAEYKKNNLWSNNR